MIEVLFVLKSHSKEECMVKEWEQIGYKVTRYFIDSGEQLETIYSQLVMCLRERTYHMLCSVNFDEMSANAAYVTGTKYVSLQQDILDKSLFSENVSYPTNYIFMCDFMAYMEYRNQRIKNIYYYGNGLQEILNKVFSDEEMQIYDIIRELEKDRKGRGEGESTKEKRLDEIYIAFTKEKDFWFRLKERLISYVDSLISKRDKDGWEEILVWYHRNITKEIRGQFWEFYILNIVLQIYKEECSSLGQSLSFMKFRSLQEVLNVYFKVIFLLRRIEYDVVPENHMEIVVYMKQYGLTDIFMEHIIENAQIEDKKKVFDKLIQVWQECDYE